MPLFINIITTFLCMPWPALIMMSPMMIAAPGFATKKSSILTAMLFFIYPSFIFLLLYTLGYSFYGTNPLWWTVTAFVLGSLVSIAYGLPHQLMNIFKGIANYDYFIKGRNVYLNGKRISDADVATFTHFNKRGYYSKDKNHVYYNADKLKHADAATFQPLAHDETQSYWHDKHHAYYKWNKIIPGAHGASFESAGHYYTFDKDKVYFENKPIAADKATFKSLADFIGRDANNVYVRETPATVNDIDTFEIISLQEETFGKDKDQIYVLRYSPPHPLLPFPDADPETFEVVGDYYAKDKNQVYYYSYHITDILVLNGANPKTFVLHFDSTRGTDATDGEQYYKAGVLVIND